MRTWRRDGGVSQKWNTSTKREKKMKREFFGRWYPSSEFLVEGRGEGSLWLDFLHFDTHPAASWLRDQSEEDWRPTGRDSGLRVHKADVGVSPSGPDDLESRGVMRRGWCKVKIVWGGSMCCMIEFYCLGLASVCFRTVSVCIHLYCDTFSANFPVGLFLISYITSLHQQDISLGVVFKVQSDERLQSNT